LLRAILSPKKLEHKTGQNPLVLPDLRYSKVSLDVSEPRVFPFVYVNNSKMILPSELLKLQAEQYRQSFPKDYRYCIQQLREGKKLSPKSLERIRTADRKNNRNVYISDQSNLLRELDAYIFDLMLTAKYS